jgi:hypothetical protein
MNKKIVFFTLVLLTGMTFAVQAQDKKKAIDEKSVTWLGIDYSMARFTLVTEDPTQIVNQYLGAINALIIAEAEKYDLKKFFHKTEVTTYLDLVNERNSKIDPTLLVVPDAYKFSADDAKKIISEYKLPGKTGMGLVFIAENLNKSNQYGSYYVVFFDMASKQIIDMEEKEGKAVGIGFRNYWTGSALAVMKSWLK